MKKESPQVSTVAERANERMVLKNSERVLFPDLVHSSHLWGWVQPEASKHLKELLALGSKPSFIKGPSHYNSQICIFQGTITMIIANSYLI